MLTLLRASKSPEARAPRERANEAQSTPGPSGNDDASDDDDASDANDADASAKDDRLAGKRNDATSDERRTAHVVDGDGRSWSRQNVRTATLVYDGACAVRVREGEDGARGRGSERRVDARGARDGRTGIGVDRGIGGARGGRDVESGVEDAARARVER